MRLRHKLFLLYLILLFSLTGCIPQKKIEDLGIITVRGTDLKDDGTIRSTFVIFEFNSEKTSGKVVSGEARTLRGAQLNADMESNFELAPAKVQLELFGKELAKQGIKPYLDILGRDANLPDTMYMALSNTNASDILNLQNTDDMTIDIGRFLHGIIEESSAKDSFPKVRLSDLLTILADTGIDIMLPIFEVKELLPKLTSIAIFRDDRYVGTLSMDNIILFNLLEKKANEDIIEVALPIEPFKDHLKEKEKDNNNEMIDAAFHIIRGKAKIKLIDKDSLNFQVDTHIDLNLIELSDQIDLTQEKTLKLLEDEFEKNLISKYETLLTDLKMLNADPIGFGAVYRAYYKDGALTDKQWRDLFPTINVKFNVKALIKNHGEHF